MAQGLRERKKADTREAIRSAAVDLFVAHGFEETTMDAIAEAADVSVRTVFRYFPTKEDLAFADAEQLVVDFTELLEDRPAHEAVMTSVRAVAAEMATRLEATQEVDVRLAPIMSREPALRRRYLEIMDRVEETVAGWAAHRLDAPPGDLRPRLLAAAIVATQRVVVDALTAGDPRPLNELIQEAVAVIGEGFDTLEGSGA